MINNDIDLKLKKVRWFNVKTAWNIYMTTYCDHLRRFQGYSYPPIHMNFKEFLKYFNSNNSVLLFAKYKDMCIGLLEVVDKDKNRMTLSRIWLLPEYLDLGYIPKIIFKFEQYFPDVVAWNLGSCNLLKTDIEACQKNGWKTVASLERMSDGCTTIQMEKKQTKTYEHI